MNCQETLDAVHATVAPLAHGRVPTRIPALSVVDPSRFGMARHGLRADGSRLLSRSDAKRLNATMLTCGTYDNAGEFAYRVGLPVKSGMGGGMVAVVPNRCTVAVWGAGLDRCGNSCAGLEALDAFTSRTGWSVF